MTAEEVLVINNVFGVIGTDVRFNLNLSRDCYIATQHNIKKAMQEYAKLKCQELLLLVAERAKTKSDDFGSSFRGDIIVDKDSILNAVDLDSFIDNKHLGTKMKLEYTTLFPKQYDFLEDRFVWDDKHESFKSKKKWLGASTGDDRSLYIIVNESGTLIYWRNSRGQEDTIFDGKELKTEEEFNQVFELLEIKTLLGWD
jgi:hypothetical protein